MWYFVNHVIKTKKKCLTRETIMIKSDIWRLVKINLRD